MTRSCGARPRHWSEWISGPGGRRSAGQSRARADRDGPRRRVDCPGHESGRRPTGRGRGARCAGGRGGGLSSGRAHSCARVGGRSAPVLSREHRRDRRLAGRDGRGRGRSDRVRLDRLDLRQPGAPADDRATARRAAAPVRREQAGGRVAIRAQARTGRLSATVLRLTNVAGGADPDPTRLIPRTFAAATNGSALEVNGDGSAVRDYLHVLDAAAAFVACVEHTSPPGEFGQYIIGSGRGSSIRDVVAAVERRTGRRIQLIHRPPAPEPAALISDPAKAASELGWYPRHSDLETIVHDTWRAATTGGIHPSPFEVTGPGPPGRASKRSAADSGRGARRRRAEP